MRFIILLLAAIISIVSCSQKDEILNKSLKKCKEVKYCEEYEKNYHVCLKENNDLTCKAFVNSIQKLAVIKDCFYEKSTTADPIPAIWKCDEGRDYTEKVFIRALILLDKLSKKHKYARDFFISPKFRSILSGESSEAFMEKSLEMEKEIRK